MGINYLKYILMDGMAIFSVANNHLWSCIITNYKIVENSFTIFFKDNIKYRMKYENLEVLKLNGKVESLLFITSSTSLLSFSTQFSRL